MFCKSRNLVMVAVLCLGVRAFATPTPIGSITISGVEQSSGSVWDTGTVTATINGVSVSVTYNQWSTPQSVAAGLAAKASQKCSFPVYAKATGGVINFYTKGSNTISSATISSTSSNPSLFPGNSFLVGGLGSWSTPLVTGVSLPEGPPSMGLTITGTGFTADSQVFVGGVLNGAQATIIGPPSSTRITVQVPSGVASSGVVVVVNGFSSNTYPFQVVNPFGCN